MNTGARSGGSALNQLRGDSNIGTVEEIAEREARRSFKSSVGLLPSHECGSWDADHELGPRPPTDHSLTWFTGDPPLSKYANTLRNGPKATYTNLYDDSWTGFRVSHLFVLTRPSSMLDFEPLFQKDCDAFSAIELVIWKPDARLKCAHYFKLKIGDNFIAGLPIEDDAWDNDYSSGHTAKEHHLSKGDDLPVWNEIITPPVPTTLDYLAFMTTDIQVSPTELRSFWGSFASHPPLFP